MAVLLGVSNSAGPMYGIAFTDTNTALAVGSGGVIIHTASAGEQPAIETVQPDEWQERVR
jgi:hypothetical protein